MTKNEMQKAKARRAKLLKEFTKLGWTKTKFAEKHRVTPARMWKMLDHAKKEQNWLKCTKMMPPLPPHNGVVKK